MSATLRGPVLGGLEQVRQRGVRAVQQAADVDVDHPLPLLDRRVLDRPEQHHAGVVDEDVEPSGPVDDLGDDARRLLGVGRGRPRRRSARARRRRSRLARSSSRSARRATTATVAPCAASASAVASPMPLEAPVTIATVSCNELEAMPPSIAGPPVSTAARRSAAALPLCGSRRHRRRHWTAACGLGAGRRGEGAAASAGARAARTSIPPDATTDHVDAVRGLAHLVAAHRGARRAPTRRRAGGPQRRRSETSSSARPSIVACRWPSAGAPGSATKRSESS